MSTPTSNDPAVIREEIEVTRATLSADVNDLADTVRPANVARRQVDKVRGAATSAKDTVMGKASDLGSAGSSAVGDAASSTQDAITHSPDAVKSRAAGNPLAAGLIAFGAGWLVASLIPASRTEQTAATKAKENASVLTDKASDAAQEVGDHLKEPAQQAVQSVKSTAVDAADTVRSEGASAAADVKDQSVQAKEQVQQSRS
jgi:hypothetical protein